MEKAKMKRYRITVPEEDADTVAWLASQINPSWSLRLLIHRQVELSGMADVTCAAAAGDRPAGSPGRPTREMVAAFGRALGGTEGGRDPAPVRAEPHADPDPPPAREPVPAPQRPLAAVPIPEAAPSEDGPSPDELLD